MTVWQQIWHKLFNPKHQLVEFATIDGEGTTICLTCKVNAINPEEPEKDGE